MGKIKDAPAPLRRKLFLTGIIGAGCLLIGAAKCFILKDRIMLFQSLLCNCDGGVRFGIVSVSPVPAESRSKSGFFARKALRDGLF